MRDVLRDCLKVAAEAAGGVVVVVEEAQKRAEGELRKRVPEPVQQAVVEVAGAVRTEADKVWSRLGDGVVQIGVVLEFLEQQVRQLQGGGVSVPVAEEDASAAEGASTPGSAPASARAERAFPASSRKRSAAARPVRVVVDEDPVDPELAEAAARRRAAVPGMKKAAERRAPAAEPAEPVVAPAKKTTAKRAPAKKAAPQQAAAKKALAKPAPAEKVAPAKKTAADKAVAGQAPARKTAAKKVPAKPVAAKKAPAKQAPAKQPPARKTAAKKAQPGKAGAGDE